MIRDRQPTTREIIAELDNPTGEISFCRSVRDSRFVAWVEPHELYIEALDAWLRCDGTVAGFALNGSHTFGRDARYDLRNAVNRWIERQARDRVKELEEATKEAWRLILADRVEDAAILLAKVMGQSS